jgi:flagellin-specific chaperone FliS
MTSALAKRHLRDAIMSMGRAELVEVVFDQALMRLQCIRELGEDAPWDQVRPHLVGCQQAVTVLLEGVVSPQAQVGDDVQALAGRLRSLYLWAIQTLVKADVTRTRPNVAALEKVLGNLADGWRRGVLGRT